MKKHKFWTFYAIFAVILIFFGALVFCHVQEVLKEYEASQPERLAEQQLEAIRKAAKQDTLEEVITFYELNQAEYDVDISDFQEYKDKIKHAKNLSFKVKNGFSEAEQKFNIIADDEVVAVLTLKSVKEEVKLAILKVNEWRVKSVTPVLTLTKYNYVVDVPTGFLVTINGTTLTEPQEASESGWETYIVETLYSEPEIKIYDAYGTEALYDIVENRVKPIVYNYDLNLPQEFTVSVGGIVQEGIITGEETAYSFTTIHEKLELTDAYGTRLEYRGGDEIYTYNYVLRLPENFTVYVNGKKADSYITDISENERYRYCLEYADMPKLVTYEFINSIGDPEPEVYDNRNQKVECVFESGYFEVTEQAGCETIPEEISKQVDVLEIAKMWSKLMTNDLEGSQNGFRTIEEYLMKGSYLYDVAYKWVTNIDITFTFSHVLKNPPFTEERVSDYVGYGNNLFSCDIYFVKHMEDIKDRNEGEIVDIMNSTFYFLYYDETDDGKDNPHWVIADIQENLSE